MSTVTEPVLTDEQPIIGATPGKSFAVVGETPVSLMLYLLIGIAFGIVLTKSEVVSWFRIQEMFRLQSVHMYGTIGTAVPVAALSLWLMRRRGVRGRDGTLLRVPPKESTPGLRRYWMGGTVFGFGWALLGACPGPIFALIGSGVTVMVVALGAALLGTWAYAWLRPVLPH